MSGRLRRFQRALRRWQKAQRRQLLKVARPAPALGRVFAGSLIARRLICSSLALAGEFFPLDEIFADLEAGK